MSAKVIIFLEVLALIGAAAFFSGQHEAHLNRLQKSLEIIERQTKASEAALTKLLSVKEDVVNARRETDKKLLDGASFDGVLRYEYYDRLLREDAERRACSSGSQAPDGAAESVR